MRKLARAAISFSAAVFAANYFLPPEWLSVLTTVSAVIGAALFLIRRKRVRYTASILIFFSLGLLCFSAHSRNTVQLAAQYKGKTDKVIVEVLDYPDVYDDYCRLYVRIRSPYLPAFKAVLYDNDKQLTDAKPAYLVSVKAKIDTADTIFGEKYDSYHSKGIYFKLSSDGKAQIYKDLDLLFLPQYFSHWLSNRINTIFPKDTEVFMRALLLGDKSDFYDDERLYTILSRSGLMHIVAVSGMHISFLVGLLHGLFGRGRRSALLCILLVWFFALVTGFGPSVVRAAFMHTCFLMAPILKRENDPITSLSAILAIILCINPFAAASVSLQLSFAAMCGIVLFADKLYLKFIEKFPRIADSSFLQKAVASISCSLSVMVTSVPLTAMHFGTIHLLSPITNLISLWAVSICFCWGWISCALSVVPLLGFLSAALCSWLARYILLVAEVISSTSFAVMYIRTKGAVLWLIVTYTLFISVYIFKKARFSTYVVLTILSAFLAGVVLYGNAVYYRKHSFINVLNVGQGQCISMFDDESTVIVDCGNINTLDNAGEMAAAHLYSCGRDSVDLLILSHLHEDHAGGAVMLMEMLDVKKLVMPRDFADEDGLLREIRECAKRKGTELTFINRDSSMEVGQIDIEFIKAGSGNGQNETCLITRLECDGIELLAMSDASARMERKLVEEYNLKNTDVLIVSHHGSKYSSTEALLEEVGGCMAIVSTGQNYYGHPDKETLEALKAYGYNVYRTDDDGDIEIRIGNGYGEENWEKRRKNKLLR